MVVSREGHVASDCGRRASRNLYQADMADSEQAKQAVVDGESVPRESPQDTSDKYSGVAFRTSCTQSRSSIEGKTVGGISEETIQEMAQSRQSLGLGARPALHEQTAPASTRSPDRTNKSRSIASQQSSASPKHVAAGKQEQPATTTGHFGKQPMHDSQQRYRLEYQDECNKIRERLFHTLSKVPIQVESSNETGKGALREPLVIKYYHQRSLEAILELHFSCSLLKHNYDRALPLDVGLGSLWSSNATNPTNQPQPQSQPQQHQHQQFLQHQQQQPPHQDRHDLQANHIAGAFHYRCPCGEPSCSLQQEPSGLVYGDPAWPLGDYSVPNSYEHPQQPQHHQNHQFQFHSRGFGEQPLQGEPAVQQQQQQNHGHLPPATTHYHQLHQHNQTMLENQAHHLAGDFNQQRHDASSNWSHRTHPSGFHVFERREQAPPRQAGSQPSQTTKPMANGESKQLALQVQNELAAPPALKRQSSAPAGRARAAAERALQQQVASACCSPSTISNGSSSSSIASTSSSLHSDLASVAVARAQSQHVPALYQSHQAQAEAQAQVAPSYLQTNGHMARAVAFEAPASVAFGYGQAAPTSEQETAVFQASSASFYSGGSASEAGGFINEQRVTFDYCSPYAHEPWVAPEAPAHLMIEHPQQQQQQQQQSAACETSPDQQGPSEPAVPTFYLHSAYTSAPLQEHQPHAYQQHQQQQQQSDGCAIGSRTWA